MHLQKQHISELNKEQLIAQPTLTATMAEGKAKHYKKCDT